MRTRDLALVEPAPEPVSTATPSANDESRPPALSRADFVRRILVLAVVVVAINLCWHYLRAWMPKMLSEQHAYNQGSVQKISACTTLQATSAA